jgi:hypothetical protein
LYIPHDCWERSTAVLDVNVVPFAVVLPFSVPVDVQSQLVGGEHSAAADAVVGAL